jgi:NADH-quinone oxidoreductase subunit A
MSESLLSLGLFTAMVVGLVALLLLLAACLGHRSYSDFKGQPYESGIMPTGGANLMQLAPFYLVAVFFVVFDVEAVFILSWAVAYDELGWTGFAQITFFVGMLLVGLAYLWKLGALDWGVRRSKVKLSGDGP